MKVTLVGDVKGKLIMSYDFDGGGGKSDEVWVKFGRKKNFGPPKLHDQANRPNESWPSKQPSVQGPNVLLIHHAIFLMTGCLKSTKVTWISSRAWSPWVPPAHLFWTLGRGLKQDTRRIGNNSWWDLKIYEVEYTLKIIFSWSCWFWKLHSNVLSCLQHLSYHICKGDSWDKLSGWYCMVFLLLAISLSPQ